ncbi:MAG: 1-deoxy-D-xylulose-5-phosphate synthase, partial [Candidatus Omnitrophica bacterium]|nr:1-deoxy-D-xylulose-5-phosphate synthase [Candidatus Omnitrophota bacterium]
KIDGLSGFPNKYESEYDVFTTGHGSTSISTALGMVAAQDIGHEPNKVVAVIGDASLGGGMAFEALNHAGHLNRQILVILNDNEMSISKSVGALSKYLNRIITAPSYNKIRKDVEGLLKRVPRFGFRVIRAAKRLEEGLKNLLVPGMFFEEMGFRYFGPIDGHDVKTIVATLRNVASMSEPVFLHVVTKKGKGYSYAEKIPEKFHGVGSFDVSTGEKMLPKAEKALNEPSGFTDAFSEAVIDAARRDERIVAVTAAMPEGTGLDKFANIFPNRFFDVGMAEQHAVGFAAGLAQAGLKPVVAIYSTFLQRAYDQIIHDVCLQNLNLIFMLDRSGLVGEDGPTHHGMFDIAYLRHVPNMVLLAPRDEKELKDMFAFALSYNKGPIAIRYPRSRSHVTELKKTRPGLEFGRAEILKQGRDVTLLGVGYMAGVSLKAASMLLADGVDCEVINARFIKPFDLESISGSLSKTKRLYILEEGVARGGFGESVLESILDVVPKDSVIKIMGLPDRFVEHGSRDILLDRCGLSAQKIREKILVEVPCQR